MPKHDPPGDDAALLELERELMELDRAIRAADENREAINYALFDRRDELMARIFNTPAAGLAGLAVQARAYLSEHEVEFADSVRCGPYPAVRPRGPLGRVAQIAEHKYCRPQARPFRLGFPRKVPVFPICPPATL